MLDPDQYRETRQYPDKHAGVGFRKSFRYADLSILIYPSVPKPALVRDDG
jgi:hypothetical protein